MAGQKYCVKWKNRLEHFQTVFADFIDRQVLCDVTLVARGETFKAHQFVLSGCSSYFTTIFQEVPATQHPIIFLRDVTSQEIKCLLDYVYRGETIVPVDLMPSFLKTCESLYIQGLCENENCRGQTTNTGDDKQLVTDRRVESSKSISVTKNNIASLPLVTETIVRSNVLRRKRKISHLKGNSNQTKQSRHISSTKRDPESGLFDFSLSNNSPDKQVNNNQESRQNLSSSITELTQVDSSNIEPCCVSEGNRGNIDSPPYSQQSIIFSLSNRNTSTNSDKSLNLIQESNSANDPDKSANSTQDSVMILSEANKEILEISDDDDSGTKTSRQISGNSNANEARDDVDSKENFDINSKQLEISDDDVSGTKTSGQISCSSNANKARDDVDSKENFDINSKQLEISDDDDSGTKTSRQISDSSNANEAREDVVSKEIFDINSKGSLERLNLRPSSCLSDDILEEFQLVLSPDIPVEKQTDESDESEIIIKRKTRNRPGSVDTSTNLNAVSEETNATKVCESVSLPLDDKMKAIQEAKRLKVILTKAPRLRSNNFK